MNGYSTLVLGDLAAAFWPLDDSSSTTAGSPVADASGAGYNGQNHCNPGAGQSSIVSGGATTWGGDGTNSIWVPSGGPLPHGGHAFSYEAWINPITGFGGFGYPAGFHMVTVWGGGAGIPSQTTFAWNEVTGSPGTFLFELVNAAGGVFHRVIAPTTDLRGSWHHAVVTWDGTTVTFYLNGAVVALDSSVAPGDIAGMGNAFTGVAAYVAGSDPSSGLNHWCGKIGAVAIYPVALTACQVQSHYAQMTTGTYTPCPHWVRLSHVSGDGYWQSKGDVTEEWAANRLRLRLPIGQMAPPTAQVLGRDPVLDIPLWVDPPAVTTSIPVPPVVVPPPVPPVIPPGPGDPCVQTRCGAALALQNKLVGDYQNWQHWINAAISFAIGGLIAALIEEIGALLVAAEVAAWVLQVFKIVTPIISTATVVSLPSLIPNLTGTQVDKLLAIFFCRLQCEGGEVTFGPSDQQAVSAAILSDTTTYPSDLMRELLGEIAYYDPLQDWQAAMTNAPASGFCAGITCP